MIFALAVACVLLGSISAAAQEETKIGTGAVLRGLDRLNGQVIDVEMPNASVKRFWDIRVQLEECRYPAEDPAADAYAFMAIYENDKDDPVFYGWMIASSPALNPLEHPRYDIWVIRCKTERGSVSTERE
ncbi:MAG: DUF2155 domain-containing protein [Roseovarius sp.]|nr:DUF2155 domain-containing protein [Roseovarius sp.]